MKTTSSFKLKLPEGSDRVSPAAMNENMEIIGGELDYLAQGVQVRELPGGDPLYAQVSAVSLADLAEGDTIQLLEGGQPVDFVVAKLNYEPELNGEGRTLLVRATPTEELYSPIDPISTYIDRLGEGLQRALEATTVPVYANDQVAGADHKVFSLSATELGLSEDDIYGDKPLGELLPTASRFIDYLAANEGASFWLRSTGKGYITRLEGNIMDGEVVTVEVGSVFAAICLEGEVSSMELLISGVWTEAHLRPGLPALTLPADFTYTLYQDSDGNYYDQQAYGTKRLGAFSRDGSISGLTVGNARIATGSYEGTGTYGADNPNSLTFGFVPRVVFICGAYGGTEYAYDEMVPAVFFAAGYTERYCKRAYIVNFDNSAGGYVGAQDSSLAKLEGTTMTWFNSDSNRYQLNVSGVTYHWVAIG